MAKLLITGFTPFDSRKINASWVAAKTYRNAHHLEIPVVWGAPMPHLRRAIEQYQPDTVISLGEGRESWFDIETRAKNTRKHRMDNHGEHPIEDISPGGPDLRVASIDASGVHQDLVEQDIPIRVSEDAGQFLCEETLYCLETLKEQQLGLNKVTFTHLPPYGTKIHYRGEDKFVNEPLLADYVQRLVKAVNNV